MDGRKWPSISNIYKIIAYHRKNIHKLYHISSILDSWLDWDLDDYCREGRLLQNSLYKRIQYMTLDCIIVVSCLGSQNFSAALACYHDLSSSKQARVPARADIKGLNSCTSVLTNTVNLKIVQKVRNQFLLKLKRFGSLYKDSCIGAYITKKYQCKSLWRPCLLLSLTVGFKQK